MRAKRIIINLLMNSKGRRRFGMTAGLRLEINAQ